MKRLDLSVGHVFAGGHVVTASPADLKALAAFLGAIADDPIEIDTTIGAFTVKLGIDRCPACWGSGRDSRGPDIRQCGECGGSGKIKELVR